jgi:uncharacterized protein YjiS (DUF1127 family)
MNKHHWFYPVEVLLRNSKRRRTIKELNALPDYLLADLGIERSAIEEIVDDMIKASANTVTAAVPVVTEPAPAAKDLLLSRA